MAAQIEEHVGLANAGCTPLPVLVPSHVQLPDLANMADAPAFVADGALRRVQGGPVLRQQGRGLAAAQQYTQREMMAIAGHLAGVAVAVEASVPRELGVRQPEGAQHPDRNLEGHHVRDAAGHEAAGQRHAVSAVADQRQVLLRQGLAIAVVHEHHSFQRRGVG
jgi:hypothetical protein